jgi:hypothetical protein
MFKIPKQEYTAEFKELAVKREVCLGDSARLKPVDHPQGRLNRA